MSGIVGTSHSKSKIIGRSQDTAKAWCNLNGTGTIAIRDSFNVSSITDNGVGKYTVSFTSNLANSDFSVAGTSGSGGASDYAETCVRPVTWAVGSIHFYTIYGGANLWDAAYANIVVFGD